MLHTHISLTCNFSLTPISVTYNFVKHNLSHTQLCHKLTQSFTRSFVTNNFVTHNSFTHNFGPHNLSHTTLTHTQNLSDTQLCHTQSFTHNFVTLNSAHTTFKIIDPPPSPLSFLLSQCGFNHFFWLLEEVDLWGYPVLHFFYPLVREYLPRNST